MCDYFFTENERCPHTAIGECSGCREDFCGSHLPSHACVEIEGEGGGGTAYTSNSPIKTKTEADMVHSESVEVKGLPGEIEEKALSFIEGCRENNLIGIVIILDGSAEMTVLGNGITKDNVADALAGLVQAGSEGTKRLDYEIRPDAGAMA